jgi:hypothetical protein
MSGEAFADALARRHGETIQAGDLGFEIGAKITEVADLRGAASPQPRRPVRAIVTEILDSAPRDPAGFPVSFTHRQLACVVYETEDPTSAQESAVRRAVARLVAEGRAERPAYLRRARGLRSTGRHERLSRDGTTVFVARNPIGVYVRRTLTQADQEARDRYEASPEAAELEWTLSKLALLSRGRISRAEIGRGETE